MKRTSSPEPSNEPGKKSKLPEESNSEEPGCSTQASEATPRNSDTPLNDGNTTPAPASENVTPTAPPTPTLVATPSPSAVPIPSPAATPTTTATPTPTGTPTPSASGDADTNTKPDGSNVAEEMDIKEEKPDIKMDERWQLIPSTVRQRMNYIMTTSKLSDCSIVVGRPELQQEFKLHSVVLAMSSPEFEDLLTQSSNLTIPDIEPDVFKQLLEYMYLDYVNLWSVEKTQALYRASVRFKLPHLCEKAVEYMMAKMSLDSIWPILDAAIDTMDKILTDECNKFFKKNILELLRHQKFPTVDSTVIASLVADDGLGVQEEELVTGVMKWAQHKCMDMDLVPNMDNKRDVMTPATIGNLRFLALSKEFFVTNVAYSTNKGDEGILTMEESYAILMNMVQPGVYSMPEGFSTLTKARTVTDLKRLMRRVFNPLGTYQTPQSPRIDKLTVLPGPALTAPFGCKSFSLDLVVSQNLTMFGIQVPTFFPGMIGTAPKLYEETYIVSLQNASKPNRPMLGSLNWTGKVAYNTFVDLIFKDSIKLEKNNTYTIMVYTNNTYYLNQKLCTVEDMNGIKFTLKDSVTLFGKSGKQDFAFISQIIFAF